MRGYLLSRRKWYRVRLSPAISILLESGKTPAAALLPHSTLPPTANRYNQPLQPLRESPSGSGCNVIYVIALVPMLSGVALTPPLPLTFNLRACHTRQAPLHPRYSSALTTHACTTLMCFNPCTLLTGRRSLCMHASLISGQALRCPVKLSFRSSPPS